MSSMYTTHLKAFQTCFNVIFRMILLPFHKLKKVIFKDERKRITIMNHYYGK